MMNGGRERDGETGSLFLSFVASSRAYPNGLPKRRHLCISRASAKLIDLFRTSTVHSIWTGRLPFFSSRDPLKKSTPTSMSFKDHFITYIHSHSKIWAQPTPLKNHFNVKPYLNLLEFAHFLFYKTHDQVL